MTTFAVGDKVKLNLLGKRELCKGSRMPNAYHKLYAYHKLWYKEELEFHGNEVGYCKALGSSIPPTICVVWPDKKESWYFASHFQLVNS